MKDLSQKIEWEVKEKPVTLTGLHHDSLKALYRDDNSKLLSIRSSRYQTFSNTELIKLVECLAFVGKFSVEGYLEFGGGRRVLAFLRNKSKHLQVVGLPAKEYLLVGNSHDASSKLFIGTANTLIRCNNQFSKKLRSFELNHTSAMEFADKELDGFLKVYEAGRAKLYAEFEKLQRINIGRENIDTLLNRLIKEEGEDQRNIHSESSQLLQTAIEHETAELGMNAWGLFNGVTWYTSHDLRNAQTTIGNVSGRAAELNKKAFDYCINLN